MESRRITFVVLSTFCLVWAGGVSLFSAFASDGNEPVELLTFKTHSRLSFRVDSTVDVKWTEKGDSFEILFSGVGLSDLGVPYGGDEYWKKKIGSFRDSRLKSITLVETENGVKAKGVWAFPSGDHAPAYPKMERFDFRKKSPVRYVVDFWQKEGPTVSEVRAQKEKRDREASRKQDSERMRRRADRRLASERRNAELLDFDKFCRRPLSEETDIFLKFPPSHRTVDFGRWFPLTTADSEYPYLEVKSDTPDARYVRLAMELYRDGKPALVVRTIGFYEAEHPNSSFMGEMKFLKANALIKLGLDKEADQILGELILTQKGSPVALHAGMYRAAKAFVDRRYLASLEGFLWLTATYPDHRLLWVFHLGSAESLYALGQTDRAAKEYQWVAEKAPNSQAQAEAVLRMGDLYMQKQQFAQALAVYSKAIRTYPEEAKKFPDVHLNYGEMLYKLGLFEKAESVFKDTLKAHPGYPAAWRASFRLGEIEGRKTGDSAMNESRNWFYYTINNFPLSAGATISRVRLIPCGDHGGFTAESADHFFSNEANLLSQSDQIVSSGYQDFINMAQIRSLVAFEKDEDVVRISAEKLQGTLDKKTKEYLEGVMKGVFRKVLLEKIAGGQKIEAIQFFEKYSGLVREESDPDMAYNDYLIKLAQAANDLELVTLSKKYVDLYKKMESIVEAGRSVASEDQDDPDVKVRQSEENIITAKSLWITSGIESKEKIISLLSTVLEDSPRAYEGELIRSLIYSKGNDPANALKHAIRASMLMGSSTVSERNQISSWIARLHEEAGDPDSAAAVYRTLQKIDEAKEAHADLMHGIPPTPKNTFFYYKEAEVFEKKGMWKEAAEVYSRAIESGVSENRMSYSYANALRKTGEKKNIQKSQEIFKNLASKKEDDFWRTLASEASSKSNL